MRFLYPKCIKLWNLGGKYLNIWTKWLWKTHLDFREIKETSLPKLPLKTSNPIKKKNTRVNCRWPQTSTNTETTKQPTSWHGKVLQMQDLLIPSDLARVVLVLLEKSTGFVGFGDFCWIFVGCVFWKEVLLSWSCCFLLGGRKEKKKGVVGEENKKYLDCRVAMDVLLFLWFQPIYKYLSFLNKYCHIAQSQNALNRHGGHKSAPLTRFCWCYDLNSLLSRIITVESADLCGPWGSDSASKGHVPFVW